MQARDQITDTEGGERHAHLPTSFANASTQYVSACTCVLKCRGSRTRARRGPAAAGQRCPLPCLRCARCPRRRRTSPPRCARPQLRTCPPHRRGRRWRWNMPTRRASIACSLLRWMTCESSMLGPLRSRRLRARRAPRRPGTTSGSRSSMRRPGRRGRCCAGRRSWRAVAWTCTGPCTAKAAGGQSHQHFCRLTGWSFLASVSPAGRQAATSATPGP